MQDSAASKAIQFVDREASILVAENTADTPSKQGEGAKCVKARLLSM